MIRNAKHTIDLITFLWQDDEVGLKIAHELAAAVKRGVRVRVMIDAYNGKKHDESYRILEEAGAPVMPFTPAIAPPVNLNLHIHYKIMTVDGTEALIGGANICDEYMIGGERGLWHDLEYWARGPVVSEMQVELDTFWDDLAISTTRIMRGYDELLSSTSSSAQAPWKPNGKTWTPDYARGGASLPGTATALLEFQDSESEGKPAGNQMSAHYQYLLGLAKKEIIIYGPYSYFRRDFQRAVYAAAKRGVKVRLLTNGPDTNDMPNMWIMAPVADYDDLMAAGVEVYEVQDRTLHAKAIWLDGEVMTVGSHNYYPRSFNFTGEAAVLTDDPNAIEKFRLMAEVDFGIALRITPEILVEKMHGFKAKWGLFWGTLLRGVI